MTIETAYPCSFCNPESRHYRRTKGPQGKCPMCGGARWRCMVCEQPLNEHEVKKLRYCPHCKPASEGEKA